MHLLLVLQLMFLLAAANGTPVIAAWLLHARGAYPLDGGRRWFDHQPLFGRSKTIRGVVSSVAVSTLAARFVGLPSAYGAVIACLAMGGDLFASFVKRRLRLDPGSRATGLDQIPESLLPLLAVAPALALTPTDVLVGVAAFFVGEIGLSRLLYRWHVRDHPY